MSEKCCVFEIVRMLWNVTGMLFIAYICMYANHAYTHAHIHMHMCARTHARTHTHTRTTHMHTHTFTCTCVHAPTHAHTHTHTHTCIQLECDRQVERIVNQLHEERLLDHKVQPWVTNSQTVWSTFHSLPSCMWSTFHVPVLPERWQAISSFPPVRNCLKKQKPCTNFSIMPSINPRT